MHIIYHDESGTHSSMVAAFIHLNLLPSNSISHTYLLKKLPHFNRTNKNSYGRLLFQGKDEYDNHIYTLGRKKVGPLVENTMLSVPLMVDSNHKVLCIDTSEFNTSRLLLGNYCSKLGLYSLGDYLAANSTINIYHKIVELVKKTKLKIAP